MHFARWSRKKRHLPGPEVRCRPDRVRVGSENSFLTQRSDDSAGRGLEARVKIGHELDASLIR
jgi:hypothetical protein